MQAKNAAHIYQPLVNHGDDYPFRLLKIHKATSSNEDVRCKLIHTSLRQEPDYEALSYTWGDLKNTSSVQLHGKEHEITTNLDLALRRIRSSDIDRIIWVDALCINQADVMERNVHVKYMREVYTHARRVLVWLGEEGQARKALQFWKEIKRATAASQAHTLFEGHGADWEACTDMYMNRPWWSRMWILQEVINDRDVYVYIGQMDPMPLEELCTAFLDTQRLANARDIYLQWAAEGQDLETSVSHPGQNFALWLKTGGQVESIIDVMLRLKNGAKGSKAMDDSLQFPPRLGAMLLRTRNQRCTDPKDRIYALLGMTVSEYDIPIDYRLSRRTIYICTTRCLLKNVLLCLLWAESPERPIRQDGELPSWVPDFTTRQSFLTLAMNSGISYFSADRGFPAATVASQTIVAADGDTFVLRAIPIAFIMATNDTRMTNDPALEGNDKVRLIQYQRIPIHQPQEQGKAVSDIEPLGHGATDTADYRSTSWGPLHCTVGDLIIVAAGSNVPLVVRKVDSGYLFIGGCWLIDSALQDLMNLQNEPGFSPLMFGGACEGLGQDYHVEDIVLV